MTATTHDTAAIFDLIAELTEQRGGKVRHNRPGDMHISCPMPDHADRTPSCHVTRDADGAILMFCFPCQLKGKDLAPAFGDERITVSALMAEPPTGQGNGYHAPKPKPPRQPKPPREPELECLGKHPKHAFPMVGKPDKPAVGETWFPREWERGFPVAWKVRQTCVRCGARTFQWRQPDGRGGTKKGKPDGVMPLCGLPDLIDAIDSGQPVHVYITEGDSDRVAVRKEGAIAVTAGGTADWVPEHFEQLDGVDRATICSDADEPGRKHARRLRAELKARGILCRVVEPVEGKDVREHLEIGHSLVELVLIAPPEEPPSQDQKGAGDKPVGRFTVRTFADIQPRTSTWLLEGVLPDDDLVVFIGEEGIGKGLFSVNVISRITRAGHNVLIIATEDHFETVLRPRLDVAGADVTRCIAMLADPETLQGQPHLPHDVLEVSAVVKEHNVRLVYIDPWVSSVSGGLRLRDTQDARRAIDPLLVMARTMHCSVLAVAHPNRGEGDLRARVGLSAVLRQAARLLLFAIEPPDDDTKLIIGIEKANETGRSPATVYRKVPRKHPQLPKPIWAVEEIPDAPSLTIRQWHDRYRTDRDQRTSDRWPRVLAAAVDGLIQRADIIAIYEETGSNQGAADKAINRWLDTGRLVKKERGIYELADD